jgi:hypothetical protein
MIARLTLAVGMAFCTFGYSACVFKSGDSVGGVGGDDGDDIGDATFSTTLTLRDSSGVATTSFVMGEPIRFDLEVLNRTNRTVSLEFPDGQIYDVYVFPANSNQVLWRWAADKSFPQVVTEVSFPPNSSKGPISSAGTRCSRTARSSRWGNIAPGASSSPPTPRRIPCPRTNWPPPSSISRSDEARLHPPGCPRAY